MICTALGCDATVTVYKTARLCTPHYQQRWSAANKPPARRKYPRTCTVCQRKTKALGLCSHHYENHRQNGDPTISTRGRQHRHYEKIRRAWRDGQSQASLAAQYNMTPSRIHQIVRGKK